MERVDFQAIFDKVFRGGNVAQPSRQNRGPERVEDSANVWGDETDNLFDFDVSTVAVKPQEPRMSPTLLGRTSPPGSPVFRFLNKLFPFPLAFI